MLGKVMMVPPGSSSVAYLGWLQWIFVWVSLSQRLCNTVLLVQQCGSFLLQFSAKLQTWWSVVSSARVRLSDGSWAASGGFECGGQGLVSTRAPNLSVGLSMAEVGGGGSGIPVCDGDGLQASESLLWPGSTIDSGARGH